MKKYNIVFIEDEILESYLNYAISVIIGRALPDVRDGLKPVHRRTLFVMKELKNYFNKPYKKSSRIVGDVIGKYHPHGEIAIYDSIVRLTQPFMLRYPLIDGQGNFGSIDGDPPAAMRYTEIRLSEFAEQFLSDLDFSTVDYISNYDNTEKYPSILPAVIPNILVNGSYGIAVGMATNIPPHNISEIVDICMAYFEDKSINIENMMLYLPGPDFPTFGIISGTNGIINAYQTGKGQILIKANAQIEKTALIKSIIVSELPYQVNKAKLIEKIHFLIKEKKINGINLVRDESDKDGLRICIEINNDYDENIILNNLYSLTQMQTIFNVNMVALVDNVPTLLNLKNIIEYFIKYRKEIIYRKIKFKLNNLEKKIHILEGFIIILFNSDNLLDIIKEFENIDNLKMYLEKKKWNVNLSDVNKNNFFNNEEPLQFKNYSLSKIQIQTILDLKISSLVKIEKKNTYINYIEIFKNIKEYQFILKNESSIIDIIKSEMNYLKSKFGDKRRTKIDPNDKKFNFLKLLPKDEMIIILSKFGYIKSHFLKDFQIQHRGGKGKKGIQLKNFDFVNNLIICEPKGFILYFSNFGKVYKFNLEDFPLLNLESEGFPIINILNIEKNEFITTILHVDFYDLNSLIVLVTKNGIIKSLYLNEFKNCKKDGLIAIKFSQDDILVDAKQTKLSDNIILFSNLGKSIRFLVKDIKITGRHSKGTIGMKLSKNEYIISLTIINNDCYILSTTENGFGKKTQIKNYPLVKKGGKGVIGMKITNKTGNVIGVENIFDKSHLLLVTNNGTILKINTNEISNTNRNTTGVNIIKLKNFEKLACVFKF